MAGVFPARAGVFPTPPGAPWRDVPPEYGPWQTVYGLFRRWQRAGVWQRVLTALQARADAAGAIQFGTQCEQR
ncbi:transposase [Saccharothrix sp. Mg75]|uniref:transposase n=1 Tax=Saccharothrix sp. Mg75 TaxID=3445357 RepID=UPI003EEEB32D